MRRYLDLLNEEMSVSQAYDYLRKQGMNTIRFDDDSLQRSLRGKPSEVANQMSAAFDFIKKHEPKDARPEPDKMKWKDLPKEGERPPWADGLTDWAIRKEDYTDANYLRRTIWEISGKPDTPLSLWIWDGERFSQHLVVLGKGAKFKEMGKAMVTYGRGDAKAVFIKGNGPALILVYTEGRYLDKPIAFETKVGKRNPNNDWDLIATLPRKLTQINKRFEAAEDDTAEDFKAWVNSDTNKVHQFSPENSFYDAIRRAPQIFGSGAGSTMLALRIQMERKGWCAVGVNTNDETTGAIVSGLSDPFVLKAARILFRLRYKNGDWNTLKIKTNDTEFVLKNRTEIREYLLRGTKPDTSKDVYL